MLKKEGGHAHLQVRTLSQWAMPQPSPPVPSLPSPAPPLPAPAGLPAPLHAANQRGSHGLCLLGERLVGAVVKAAEEGQERDGPGGEAARTKTGSTEPRSGEEGGHQEGGQRGAGTMPPGGFEWRLETGGLTGGKKWGLIAEREGAEVVSRGGAYQHLIPLRRCPPSPASLSPSLRQVPPSPPPFSPPPLRCFG